MVKMHKLTKGGQTIFPATIYDAVVNPNTRKSLTTELSELENEEIYLKTQIEGSIDKDLITENTVWIDGTWDWETNSSAGNSIQKQNYKHTKLTDVGYYDTLKMSGLSEKVDASDIFPSISIYSGSEQIEYLRGSSAVINMDKYSDRSNINIIIQAKQDNSIIPSVIANSKAKVVKPEELIPIQSSLKKIEGSETDVVDALVWNKKRWETGTNQPNGGELQYNATQKIWYARIDISEYDSIICDGLLNGSSISTSASTLNGICIYGDNILIKGIKDASNENIINRSDYSQYSKLELILQCKSTSDNEFIAVGEPSVRAIIYSTIASKNEFDKLSLGVNQNSSDIGKIYNLIEGVDNKDIFSLFVWNKRRWLNFITTAKARSRLTASLRKDRRKIIAKGEKILKEFFESSHIEYNNDVVTKILSNLGIRHRDDLFYKIGNDEITPNENIKKIIKGKSQNPFMRYLKLSFGSNNGKNEQPKPVTPQQLTIDRKQTYILRDENGVKNYKVADCCCPIPGDDVLGYVEDDETVVVHKRECPVAMRLKSSFGPRLVSTQWEASESLSFPAKIEIQGIDRIGILNEITRVISNELIIDMRGLTIKANEGVFTGTVNIMVHDTRVVESLCNKLRKIKGVQKVARCKE